MAALVDALASMGVDDVAPGDGGLIVEAMPVTVEVRPVVSAAIASELVDRLGDNPPVIVVADRVATAAREALREAGIGYLDRRGHLRFVLPPIVIDAPVPASVSSEGRAVGALDRPVAVEVAIACMLEPRRAHGVREVAAFIERAPSAVSAAMAGMRAEGLLTSEGQPLVPDLFNEVAAVWRRRFVAMADLPRLEDATEWALTETLGALAWGMPVVATADYPPDFYVPDEGPLRRAVALLGRAADYEKRLCSVGIVPVRLACMHRSDLSQRSTIEWPVANHIVVALDLAQDRARGREILDGWHPRDIDRAW
jgi:hypothetical protein